MDIRNVTLEDAPQICSIYNYYIEHTAITFETVAVSVNEMQKRIENITNNGNDFYVAVDNDKVVGYCYIHQWNGRCAYSSTKEVSIYIDNDIKRKHTGTLLYTHLFNNLDRKNIHALIAGISLPNEASVKLHEKFGFNQVSHFKQIGWKFDQWQDVGHWQIVLTNCPKILILCTGNSCRSQMAHGFLQSFDSELKVFSAGTKASGKLNPTAVKVMQEAGTDISHYSSDSIDKYLNEDWDYVITVCGGANESCPTFTGNVKQQLHIGFDDPSDATGSPEFIYSEFIRVRDEIKKRFAEFYITEIKKQKLPECSCAGNC